MSKKQAEEKKQEATVGAAAKTEVAATASTQVGAALDFGADAGAGLEGADKDSFAIPFLAGLQANSPAVDEVEGAKAGMFMNTVTQELFEHPRIIPCAFQRRWVRWAPREAGGGYKGELTTAQVNELREKGEVKELDGRLYYPEADGSVNPKKSDRLSDTRSHYVLIVDGPNADFGTPAVFALASTGIKVSKNFLSRIEARKIKVGEKVMTAPSFSAVYEVSTTKKTNEKGSWYQADVAPVGEITNPNLYAQAKAFFQNVTAGKVQAAHETAQNPEAGGDGGAGGAGGDNGAF